MLELVRRWLWSLNDNVIQYGFQLSYIMPISPGGCRATFRAKRVQV
jgi:hypothetical protein